MKPSVTLTPTVPSADPKTWQAIERLYLAAFPESERRPVDSWRDKAETDSRFSVLSICEEELQKGFISYWSLDNFIYVEHFAITPDHRSGGTGSRALQQFLANTTPTPIILEIEPPSAPITLRRQNFYIRNGFTPSPRPYAQPPYSPTQPSIPLRLLSTAPTFLEEHWDEVVRAIHGFVYGVQENATKERRS